MKGFNSLLDLRGYFTKEQYPPNENNISIVPHADIHEFLVQNFDWYETKVTTSGNSPEGNYVTIALSVPIGNNRVTVIGASDGPLGMAGLCTLALRNAVLRGLGAGLDLYEHEEGQEPNFGNNHTNQPPQRQYDSGQVSGRGNGQSYQARSNGSSSTYGPWTGEAKLRSSKNHPELIGTAWKDLPDDFVHGLANVGVELALKEMDRRGVRSPSGSDSSFPRNAFSR